MALIKCPECDGGVSDKVDTCPHCALPNLKKAVDAFPGDTVGERVRTARKRPGWGWTAKELAARLNLPSEAAARAIEANAGLNKERVLELARVLKVRPEHLDPYSEYIDASET